MVMDGKGFSSTEYTVYYYGIGGLFGLFISACVILNVTYDTSLLLLFSNIILFTLFASYVIAKILSSTDGKTPTEAEVIRKDFIAYMGVLVSIFAFYHVIIITLIYLLFPTLNSVLASLQLSVKAGLGIFVVSYIVINLLLFLLLYNLGKRYIRLTARYVNLTSNSNATTYELVSQIVNENDQ